jgi:hypothetical protein
MAWACSLSRDIAAAANAHIAAQSMSSAMHRAIILTSCSCKQDAAQWLQATAQMLQASMQALNFRLGIFGTPWFVRWFG